MTVDELLFFLDRVGVVEAQVAFAAERFREAEVEADRFGVADVQVAVRFRREARVDASVVFAGGEVFLDDLVDEVGRRGVFFVVRFAHKMRITFIKIFKGGIPPAPFTRWRRQTAAGNFKSSVTLALSLFMGD